MAGHKLQGEKGQGSLMLKPSGKNTAIHVLL